MSRKHRIYCSERLNAASVIVPDGSQKHYLHHVLRLKTGDMVFLFNETDGEWQGEIIHCDKHRMAIELQIWVRGGERQSHHTDRDTLPVPILCFAPIKRQRLELLLEKSVELGVGALQPVITQYCNAGLPKAERSEKLLCEAAEQCGRLSVPKLLPVMSFTKFCQSINSKCPVLFFREQGSAEPAPLWFAGQNTAMRSARLLIGPEGGFSPDEMAGLETYEHVTALSLGNRILRSETAAMAALTLWHSHFGDFVQTRMPASEPS